MKVLGPFAVGSGGRRVCVKGISWRVQVRAKLPSHFVCFDLEGVLQMEPEQMLMRLDEVLAAMCSEKCLVLVS